MGRKRRERNSVIKQKGTAGTKTSLARLDNIVPRTPGQYDYVQAILDHDITLAVGPAGSGKSFLAIAMAVRGLVQGEYRRLILTRPAVEAAHERLGFLPGDALEKIHPYMIPLYESLEKVLGPTEVRRLIERNIIEVVPLAYMRGRTFDNAFIVLDEGQNTCKEQVQMLLTRLGNRSKIIITGDIKQNDIRNGINGLEDAVLRFYGNEYVATALLRKADIQRSPLVARVVSAYEEPLPEDLSIEDIYRKYHCKVEDQKNRDKYIDKCIL